MHDSCHVAVELGEFSCAFASKATELFPISTFLADENPLFTEFTSNHRPKIGAIVVVLLKSIDVSQNHSLANRHTQTRCKSGAELQICCAMAFIIKVCDQSLVVEDIFIISHPVNPIDSLAWEGRQIEILYICCRNAATCGKRITWQLAAWEFPG